MPKYIDPLEKALAEGRDTITAGEAVSLREKPSDAEKAKAKPKRRGRNLLARAIVRRFRELWGGPKTYLRETPRERRFRVEEEEE